MDKNELRKLRYLNARIDSKIRQLQSLKMNKYTVRGIDYERDKIKTSGVIDPNGLIIKIIDLERELDNDLKELLEKKNSVRKLFKTVDGIQGVILDMRYLECMSWQEIAYQVHYSVQHVHKLHKEGIEMLSQVISGEKEKQIRANKRR